MNATEEFVVRKGLDLVWQNPRKDKQCIVQMARISPRNGYLYTGKIHWDIVETPTEKGYYHFYQLGDNYPGDFNLIARKNQWYRLSEWCKVIDLVIHIYDKKGRLLPLRDAYTLRTYNDNIIIAVMRNDQIYDINDEVLYIHFYRNYFYRTIEKDTQEAHIEYYTNTHGNKSSTNTLINQVSQLITTRDKGKWQLIHNGYYQDNVDTANLQDGDITEIHYDMSFVDIIDFPINQLRTFKSTLDNINKYILHPPKDAVMGINTIRYRDDLDIFICRRDPNTNRIKGLYYHRNMENSVRMLTHRDWSLPVPYVMNYIETLDENANLDNFFIRVYVRDNGPDKEWIEDTNMITSLYKLSDDKIIEAMAKVDSTVDEWKANTLEQSPYTALMRSYRREVTPALVLDAFGYSSSASLLANPNHRITIYEDGKYFILPQSLRGKTAIYEYDKNGYLLGWYNIKNRDKHYPINEDAVFIEAYAGETKESIDINIGKSHRIIPNRSYRFYSVKLNLELGTSIDSHPVYYLADHWKDITSDKRLLISEDKDGMKVNIDYNDKTEAIACLDDSIILAYTKKINMSDGVLDFNITMDKEGLQPLYLPLGKLDIWLNGRSLIEGIDYYVNYPNVIIVSKKYIIPDSDEQYVSIRFMGFPFQHNGVLKRIAPKETGFIQWGKMSVNNHYDIHENKILRTVVNGGTFDSRLIPFDEQGMSNVKRFTKDGYPYSVEEHYISIQGTLGISLYQAQLKDYKLTKKVSEYLTQHVEKVELPSPPVIPDKYEIYSPFLSKITMDLYRGNLKSPGINTPIDTIDKIIKDYKHYLKYDPIIRGYDKHFVNVHAHNQTYLIELSPRDITFLDRLNKIYLKGEIDTSKFFKVRKLN